MERSLIREIGQKELEARLMSNKVKPVYYPNFFDMQRTESLKYETLIGEKGAPVMADVVSYDAAAPIKSREIIKSLSGDIPKISIKRGMIESDLIKYNQIKYSLRNRTDLIALLDLGFKDVDFCFNGVMARKEWLAMQALSLGQISLTTQNNGAGRVTEEVVSFGVPADNKSGVAVLWATIASSTPITDFKVKQRAARDAGRVIKYALMRPEEFENFMASTETKDMIKSFVNNSGNLLITKDTVNSFLTANGLPTIVIVDPLVRHESKNHSRSNVNPWASGYVTFVPELKVGSMQYGPIVAEDSETIQKVATLIKRVDTMVTKWSEIEPFREWTKAEANVFPVLDDPEELFLLNTKRVTDWS